MREGHSLGVFISQVVTCPVRLENVTENVTEKTLVLIRPINEPIIGFWRKMK